jgi:hypothetical protein
MKHRDIHLTDEEHAPIADSVERYHADPYL